MRKNLLLQNKLLFLSLIIVLIDQLTKLLAYQNLSRGIPYSVIPNFLEFNLVFNTGAAFSILSNNSNLLGFLSLAVSTYLFIWIIRHPTPIDYKSIGIAFLLGGSLGNGIDRFLKGYVIDFIATVPINFPVFNIADIAINIAIILLLLDYFNPK